MISSWLMIIALVFFSLSVMSETRLVYAIYQSSYEMNRSSTTTISGCKFFALYCITSISLISIISRLDGLLYLLVFSYSYLTNFVWIGVTSCVYLLPQIVSVFLKQQKYKFNFWHILGLAATRVTFMV